jgi:hypothetical protein
MVWRYGSSNRGACLASLALHFFFFYSGFFSLETRSFSVPRMVLNFFFFGTGV